MIHYLATAFVDFLVAAFALSSKTSTASRPMALVAVSMGLWSLELFVLSFAGDPYYLDTLFHLTRWGMFFIPPSLMLLTWSLIGRSSERFYYCAVVPNFLLSIGLCLVNFFFIRSKLEPVTGGYQPVPDIIYSFFSILFLASVVICICFGVARYRQATYREIQRIRWLIIVLAVTLLLGVASMMLIRYPYYLKLVGASINMVFIGLLFYATVRHHLMDVRLAFSVGLVKATAIAAILWVYFFTSNIVGDVIDPVSHIIMMAVFVYIFLELYPRYEEWALSKTKKIVSRTSYDTKKLKKDISLMFDASFDRESFEKALEYLFIENMNLAQYCLVTVDLNSYRLNEKSQIGGVKFNGFDDVFDGNIIRLCESCRGLTLTDECSGSLRNAIESKAFNGFFGVFNSEELAAIVFLGKPLGKVYYHYDDMIMVDWLSKEIAPNVERLYKLEEFYEDLRDAKKTLSLLGVMNHYHHDIKAPLAIIDGVLSNDIYDKEKQREIVLKQVERGSRLITTMASLLKGERKRKVSGLSLEEVVNDSVFLFSQGMDEIHYDFGDVPNIRGDADDLKILVINIIKNAIEARQKDKKLIVSIATWQTDEAICLSFSDSGEGMPQQVLDTLWDEAISSKLMGNGIGMQAIKRIADEHSADIEVKSQPGKGTEFIFKFPLSIVDEGQDDPPSTSGDNLFSRINKPMAG